jgi:hypothetical protein
VNCAGCGLACRHSRRTAISSTVGGAPLAVIKRYIANQKNGVPLTKFAMISNPNTVLPCDPLKRGQKPIGEPLSQFDSTPRTLAGNEALGRLRVQIRRSAPLAWTAAYPSPGRQGRTPLAPTDPDAQIFRIRVGCRRCERALCQEHPRPTR